MTLSHSSTAQQKTSLWRFGSIALCALVLCSCRCPKTTPFCPTLSQQSTKCPPAIATETLVESYAVPLQEIDQTWPEDEYVVDGGHSGPPMTVGSDWEINGLHVEDTIAHFDTLDGQTKIQPSNRVYIYSPRFAAVRKVVGLVQNEQKRSLADVDADIATAGHDDSQSATLNTQNIQAEHGRKANPPSEFLAKQDNRHVSVVDGPEACQDALLPYENMFVIRFGVMKEAEMARLAEGIAASRTWSGNESVQVILDETAATEVVSDQEAKTIYAVKLPKSNPKLRIIKVASTDTAKQGEIVYFTLRFDNVGNEVIGNVTLLDNLSPRLEYVPKSSRCSLDVDFSTERNESGSLLLRWDFKKPLEAGKGGVIRFQIRVR